MQPDQVDCCSTSFLSLLDTTLGGISEFDVPPQLAALKLIDLGKITFDTPVGDHLPEFRNPIIVDRTSTQKTAFRPAKTVVTVKHLLNSSSGLFYPLMVDDLYGMHYKSKDMHQAADPVAQFFRMLLYSQFHFGVHVILSLMSSVCKGELPGLPLKFEPGTDCMCHGFDDPQMKLFTALQSSMDGTRMFWAFWSKKCQACRWKNSGSPDSYQI